MTRIIAGLAGGTTLAVPKSGTRPTSDRVREAIFSSLESEGALDGADVLDLYAGTGALGLEALSRGAACVTLVEKAPRAAAVLRKNAEAVQTAVARTRRSAPRPRVRTLVESAAQAVAHGDALTNGVPFSLVFIDPPYEVSNTAMTELLTALVPFLTREAIIILERSARDPMPDLPEGLSCWREKAYGETAVYSLEVAESVPSAAR